MMKLFSKNSNLCDHNSPTSQTDRQTDMQSQYRALHWSASRGNKTFWVNAWNCCRPILPGLSVNTDSTCHQCLWSSTTWRYTNSVIIKWRLVQGCHSKYNWGQAPPSSPAPPLPPLRSRPPSIQLGGLGVRCKLPQRGLGRSASRNRIWCILALKSESWWQQF